MIKTTRLDKVGFSLIYCGYQPGSPQCHLPTQLEDVPVSTILGTLSALEALCDYALYKSTFTLHLHYIRQASGYPSDFRVCVKYIYIIRFHFVCTDRESFSRKRRAVCQPARCWHCWLNWQWLLWNWHDDWHGLCTVPNHWGSWQHSVYGLQVSTA